MTSFTITIDKKNGKLLLIAKDRFKNYHARNEKAGIIIKELANNIKINKLIETEPNLFVRCKECDIVIDSSDERLANYRNELMPLADKIFEFDRKNNKNQISNKVSRQNVLSRNKVTKVLHSPRIQEIKDKVKEMGAALLEEIITKANTKKMLKVSASFIAVAILASGAIGLNSYLNNKAEAPEIPDDKIVIVDTNPEIYTQPSIITEFEPETELEPVVEEPVVEEPVEEDYQYVEMVSAIKEFYPSKADKVLNLYGDDIKEVSEKYGLPYSYMLAVATQEGGFGPVDPKRDAKGLFQIRASIYVGYEIRNYNFLTNAWEKHVITMDDLCNEKTNIDIAGRIAQENYFNYSKGNPLAAMACYHFGPGGINSVAGSVVEERKTDNPDLNLTAKDVLTDFSDFGWLRNFNYAGGGYDFEYFQKVINGLHYFDGDKFEVAFKNVDGTVNVADFEFINDDSNVLSFNVNCQSHVNELSTSRSK